MPGQKLGIPNAMGGIVYSVTSTSKTNEKFSSLHVRGSCFRGSKKGLLSCQLIAESLLKDAVKNKPVLMMSTNETIIFRGTKNTGKLKFDGIFKHAVACNLSAFTADVSKAIKVVNKKDRRICLIVFINRCIDLRKCPF